MGQIAGSDAVEGISKDFTDGVVDGLKQIAQQQNMKASNQVLGKELKKQVAVKPDLQAGHLDVTASFGLNDTEIDKIIPLLNEATFTAKNYLHSTIEKTGGLKLGETNILRAIMAALGVAFPENNSLQ